MLETKNLPLKNYIKVNMFFLPSQQFDSKNISDSYTDTPLIVMKTDVKGIVQEHFRKA